MKLSEGIPNGVSTLISRTSLKPSILYNPLPPIMPIRAFSILSSLIGDGETERRYSQSLFPSISLSHLFILSRLNSFHLASLTAAESGHTAGIEPCDIDFEVGRGANRIFQGSVFQRATNLFFGQPLFE